MDKGRGTHFNEKVPPNFHHNSVNFVEKMHPSSHKKELITVSAWKDKITKWLSNLNIPVDEDLLKRALKDIVNSE
jgi:hypothetical protein